MKLSIMNFLRAASAIGMLAVMAGCGTLTPTAGKWWGHPASAVTELASAQPVGISESGGERRTTAAGQWLADVSNGLGDMVRITAGGVGGAIIGSIGGAGAGFLAVAKSGGCLDPTTCGSLVAGVMTAGAVIGGVMGFVEGAREARLELAANNKARRRPAGSTYQPILRTEPSPATTSE